jgi:WD40 repeat protein
MVQSADGRWLATGGSDRRLRLWDLQSGQCGLTIEGHAAFIIDAAFHPDGQRLLSASADATIRVWDLGSGECLRTLEGHNGPVNAVVALPGGRLAASAGEDGTVRVWELESGELRHTVVGHEGRINALAATADGSVLLSAGEDQTLRFWNVAAGSPARVLRFGDPLRDLTISSDGRLAALGLGRNLQLVDLTVEPTFRIPYALTLPVTAGEVVEREHRFRECLASARRLLEADQHEETVAALREARSIPGYAQHSDVLELWGQVLTQAPKEDIRSISELRSFKGSGAQLTDVLFTPDTLEVVAAAADGTVLVWNRQTGAVVRSLQGHRKLVSALALGVDGRTLLSASWDGDIRLWELSSGSCLRVLPTGDETLSAVAVTADGRSALTAGNSGAVHSWSLDATGPPRLLGSHTQALSSVATSRDGRFVVSGGWDQLAIIWDASRGTQLHILEGHEGAITAAAVSDDCRRLATAGEDGSVRLWDTSNGRMVRLLRGHEGAVTAVAVSPDVRFLLTGGKDGSLKVWDAGNGACLKTTDAHTSTVTSVSFSPEGRFALTCGADGVARVWFLDWEPAPRPKEDWDERARPFLEVFLRLRQPDGEGPPQWADEDLWTLSDDLSQRGFGWIPESRLRRELEQMTASWGERRTAERRAADERHADQMRQQKAAPLANLVARLTRNLGLKLAALAIIAIGVVLALQSVKVPVSTEIAYNDTLRGELRAFYEERSAALKAAGRVMAFQGDDAGPLEAGVAGPECDHFAAPGYLDLIIHPQAYAGEQLEPTRRPLDREFSEAYRTSVTCLPRFVDGNSTQALLDSIATGPHPLRHEDVLTILVQSGKRAIPTLDQNLGSGNVEIRHTAAQALADMGSEQAMQILLTAAREDSPLRSEAAYFVLKELIADNRMTATEAFALIKELTYNIDPRIRRYAINALLTFRETGPVNELLDAALEDPNPEVVQEARSTRRQIRAARRKELIGDD